MFLKEEGVGSCEFFCQAVLALYPGYPLLAVSFGSVSINLNLLICDDTNDSIHLHGVIVRMNQNNMWKVHKTMPDAL